MFYILKLILIFGICSGRSAEKANIDDILKKMDKPDPNFVSSIKDFKNTFENFFNNKDPDKDFSLLARAMESSLCLQSFGQNVDPKVIEEIMNTFSEQNKAGEEKMKKMMSQPEKIKAEFTSIEKIGANPREACHFSVDQNTDAMKKIKMELAKDQLELDKILGLKKNIHPTFFKLISDLEKQKSKLVMAASNRSEISLEPKQYEKNFVKVYNYQCKLVDDFSRNKIALMPSTCINSVRTIFNTTCKGKPKYALVRGQFTQLLLCTDDNLAKIDRSCNYKVSFIK